MLTASTSHLWTACALSGSVHSGTGGARPGPEAKEDSEARREGIAAGWVAECCLRGDAASPAEFMGETAPNGWTVDQEMVNCVTGYVELLRSFGVPILAEQTVSLWGLVRMRIDAHPLTRDRVLHLFDYKHGRRIVEAEGNSQLLCEALALWHAQLYDRVELHIYQPRPYHPDGPHRTWKLDGDDMAGWHAWLWERAEAASKPDAIATPGGQCVDCSGAARCYAATATSYMLTAVVQDSRMIHLTPAELAREWDFIQFAEKVIKARHGAVAAELEGRIKGGEYVPGWHLEDRQGNRVFTVEPPQRLMTLNINPYKQVERSPAEMENEGADPEKLKMITRRPHAGKKLARLDRKYFDRLFK